MRRATRARPPKVPLAAEVGAALAGLALPAAAEATPLPVPVRSAPPSAPVAVAPSPAPPSPARTLPLPATPTPPRLPAASTIAPQAPTPALPVPTTLSQAGSPPPLAAPTGAPPSPALIPSPQVPAGGRQQGDKVNHGDPDAITIVYQDGKSAYAQLKDVDEVRRRLAAGTPDPGKMSEWLRDGSGSVRYWLLSDIDNAVNIPYGSLPIDVSVRGIHVGTLDFKIPAHHLDDPGTVRAVRTEMSSLLEWQLVRHRLHESDVWLRTNLGISLPPPLMESFELESPLGYWVHPSPLNDWKDIVVKASGTTGRLIFLHARYGRAVQQGLPVAQPPVTMSAP